MFWIAANCCDPALEFLKRVIYPKLFHAYLSTIFRQPRKCLLLRQTILNWACAGKGLLQYDFNFWTNWFFSLFKLPITALFCVYWRPAYIQCGEVFPEIKPFLQQLRTYQDCVCKQVSVLLASALIVAAVKRKETIIFRIFCPFPLVCKWVLVVCLVLKGNLPWYECSDFLAICLPFCILRGVIPLSLSHIYSGGRRGGLLSSPDLQLLKADTISMRRSSNLGMFLQAKGQYCKYALSCPVSLILTWGKGMLSLKQVGRTWDQEKIKLRNV